jgi:serine/threonine-protein kinase
MTSAEVFSHLKRGSRLDAYRIREWKGGGSYGDVYQAVKDGLPVALKVSKHRHRGWSNDPARTDERLLRELVCLAHLDHPHIAQVHGWARTRDGRGYLAMEYVDGWTLAHWCGRARPTVQQVVRLFAKLAHAVEHMHSRRVRHRDLSPSNVMVRKADGEPVVIDFGAGEYSGAPELTDTPLPPGTLRYRSPEALRFFKAHRDDPSARYAFPPEDDFYALAVCLYDALTDPEPTCHGESRKAPRIDVNSPRHAPPSARTANPHVPEALSAWLEKWMAGDLEARRPALASMREALEELGARQDAEWLTPVQPPPDAGAAAPASGGRSPAGVRRRVLAGAAAVLAAAGLVTLLREAALPEAPPAPAVLASSRAPEAPPPQLPASPPAPSARAVPSPAESAPVEKESPAVSPPQTPPPSPPAKPQPKKSAPAVSPALLAKCAGVTALAAAQLGCPPQVLPTRDRCPTAAVEAMQEWHLDDQQRAAVTIDVKQPNFRKKEQCEAAGRSWQTNPTFCAAVLGDGAVEGQVRRDGYVLPKGTRLFGRIWTGGDKVVGRYTLAITPEGDELPICLAFLNGGEPKLPGSKPGAAVVDPETVMRFIHGQWP